MITYILAFVAGAAIVSQADWAHDARAWLRRQTLGHIGL